MKHSKEKYIITKEYNDTLRKRYALFTDETKTHKTVHTTIITTFGIKRNMYWGNIQSEVKPDDLFAFLFCGSNVYYTTYRKIENTKNEKT